MHRVGGDREERRDVGESVEPLLHVLHLPGASTKVAGAPSARCRIHMQSKDGCNDASSPLSHTCFLSFLLARCSGFNLSSALRLFPFKAIKRGRLCSGL